MSYEAPTLRDIEACAAADGIDLQPGEAAELLPVISGLVSAADFAVAIDAAEFGRPADVRLVDSHRPTSQEDPFNVFITKCCVEGAAAGPLRGKTVGLKDNISLAGVPTTNGSRLTPYVPTMDAIVVERILAAGATIVGKLNMDDFGAAGTGETSAFGAPRNPVNPAYSAGGSSGGSGAAVRAGEVDLALGVDQGGSGRIPAAFCGVVAAKGTHGLVPSFGITHIDHTIDSVTPIAGSVTDAALLLEVVAGQDARDPQWVRGGIAPDSYTGAEADGVRGLSIAIVLESCVQRYCTTPVLDGVSRAAQALEEGGATISRVSVPIWEHAFTIFRPYIGILVAGMFRSDGAGYGHLGSLDPNVITGLAIARTTESSDIAKQVKCWVISDRYLHDRYANEAYALLHNLRLLVRRTLSELLDEYDLLLTPTIPFTAPRLLSGEQTFSTISSRTSEALAYNTSPLNLSGHPALSVPSGADENGMPTAVQIVGTHFDERMAFRAAFELERALGPFLAD